MVSLPSLDQARDDPEHVEGSNHAGSACSAFNVVA
jgi:hypothetical protein